MKNPGRITIFLFVFYSFTLTCPASDKTFRNNKIRWFPRESSIDTSRINNLARAGFRHLKKESTIDVIKSYIDSAVVICEKNNIEIPSLLSLLMAEYHYLSGDFRKASEEAAFALKQSSEMNEHNITARAMAFLGRYYHRTGFYKESLEYYENSIGHSKKYRLKGIIPGIYYGQARVFNAMSDVNGFRQNLQMMIESGIAENDSESVVLGYYLLGTSWCGATSDDKRRDFRKADSLLKKSNRLALIKKDSVNISNSLANTGWNFYLEKKYDSSLYYYDKSLIYNIAAKIYSASANSLGNIGTIYRDLNQPEVSIKYYLNSIEHAKKVNDWYSLKWVYEDMSQMYLRINDTSNAFKSYVLFKKFSDTLLIKERSQGLSDALLRYEADTQNKELELLSLRLKNNRLLNYGFAVLIILISTIGLLLLRGSRLKAKRSISEMNRKISEITQANLRQQMNPHFIFNTLNSIQYYMYQHDKLATNNYLTKFSNLMRKVLDNSQHTSITLSDELNALRLYLELESIRFKDKFDYKITIDEEIDPLMYKVPTMLIQPYVENSICHGLIPMEGKGIVRIDLNLGEDYLLCVIEDNGIGREAARERKFMRDSNHNSLGTQITASRLDLVNALYGTSLKTTYTDLKNDAGEPEGTRVEIHIPILT